MALIFVVGAITGLAYGPGAGAIHSDQRREGDETPGVYLVLVFFAAQFVAYFGWTNLGIITPMMSYSALIVAFMQRYREDSGIGTIVARMPPYPMAFFVVWTSLLIVWILFGPPLGPGAEMYLT